MDVSMLASLANARAGLEVAVSGWLVDREDGLFLMANHYPEDYEHPLRIKIQNDGIMYPILAIVPVLVGGKSLLFFKAKMTGILVGPLPCSLLAQTLEVEIDRNSDRYVSIDISPAIVQKYIADRGAFRFGPRARSNRDWLTD